MNMIEFGFCPDCAVHHAVKAPGLFTRCGVLCSMAVLVGPKRPELGAALMLASLLFGDAIERWVRARCPECGSALRLAASIAG